MSWVLRIVVAAVGLGCSTPSDQKPDVLLITWDTVRADHVGQPWTPTWNELSKQSAVFTNARTPAPITLPAHASIMTGYTPPQHQARDNGTWPVASTLPTLAERFRDGGWSTGGFISATVLDSRYGIARGFSTFNDHIRPGVNRTVAHRPGLETVAAAVEWLGDKEIDQAVFMWVHLFDPHRPWTPSEDPSRSDYQAAIAKADAATSTLIDAFRARGTFESSILVLASDHGEGLGEHGEQTHGYFAYDSTIRVPMLMRIGPGNAIAPTEGIKVGGMASLLDVTPTVLAAAGLEPMTTEGLDLSEALSGQPISPRALSVEAMTPALDFDAAPIFGVYDTHKQVWYDSPLPERYRIDSDPKQLVNRYVPADKTEATDTFSQFPRKWPQTSDPMALSEQDREALEALGYITRPEIPTSVSTVDAKDRVAMFNLLTNTPEGSAMELLEQAESMTDAHGPVPALMLFRADLLDALGRSLDALDVVRTAAMAHPSDRDLNGEFLKREEERAHLQQMSVAIRRELQENPSNGEAQRDLAITLHRLQRFREAEQLYRQLLEAHPANDEFRVDLARMFASQARYDTALSTLAPALRRPKHDPSVDCLAGKLMSRGKDRDEAAAVLLSRCE